MRKKNLITWKDADQNLCHLAAVMLSNAMQELRNSGVQTGDFVMDNGKELPPGYAEPDGSKRTIYSDEPTSLLSAVGDADISYEISPDDVVFYFDTDRPSTLCWWSFQNLIRWRLRKARRELARNVYQSKPFKKETEKNCSRNQEKRPEGSKYGRQAERE